jgi:serine/arginine repetitive matrix protein 2
MYGGEGKRASTPAEGVVDLGNSHEEEGHPEGAAIEVIEMANGETIWYVNDHVHPTNNRRSLRSIVNGLRDDDLESAYASRTSLTSEYSLRDNSDGLQVFVKEHGKSASKGSSSSFLSRKKPSQSKSRPETKVRVLTSSNVLIADPGQVFYRSVLHPCIWKFGTDYLISSSSAHIGRLIESLSQGMDAGSFNFGSLPPDRSTPSSFHSDADMQWTIEEKLEHMLGSMRNT